MSKEQPATSILIADDHPVFRHGLRALLEAEPDFRVDGEAGDGAEVLELVPRLKPNVLLLDLAMPRLPGMEVLRELATSQSRKLSTILLTVAIEKEQIVEALQLGARGVVMKDSATQILIKAIHAVMAGQYWVGRESVADMAQYLRRILPPAGAKREQPRLRLSRREREIIAAIVQGCTNREVAEKLSISEDTVKGHLSRIFDKTGMSTRLELALFAVHNNLAYPFEAGRGSRFPMIR